MLPIFVPRPFRIIAHRGASAYAPENTAPAFQLAVEMGVHEVELDAQLTTDGVVVLCHDRTLERYGHGANTVEALHSAQLLELDMGSWFSPYLFRGEKMLTLAGLFELHGDHLIYHVEIKGHAPNLPQAVASLIDKYELANRCIITSFHLPALRAMRAFAPRLPCGWLIDRIDEQALAVAQELGLFQLCPKAELVETAAVQRARAVVAEARAWGLAGSSQEVIGLIQRVVGSGCDGMTINWPDWVKRET
jgi:glycerophosphoryl diester phosphodiesterase